jgi:hypothetical protein
MAALGTAAARGGWQGRHRVEETRARHSTSHWRQGLGRSQQRRPNDRDANGLSTGGCEDIPRRGRRDEREIKTKYKKISVKSQKKRITTHRWTILTGHGSGGGKGGYHDDNSQ